MTTLERLKNWLETERGRWPAIAAEAGVTYNWITRLMQGRIQNPGVDRVERLSAVMRREKRRANRKRGLSS